MDEEQEPQQPQVSEPVEEAEKKPLSIQSLLRGLLKHKASDLHVKVGRPPLYRINGKLLPAKLPALDVEDVKRLAYSTMTSKQIKEFEENLQVDFGYLVPGMARFRTNVYMQKGTLAFVIRMVPLEVPVLASLHLPPILEELALKSRGLLLVCGATGSGKSTTMAAMIEHINRNCRAHVVTIEDPIEYIFDDKVGTVSQREVGVDATNMTSAMRAALRQDPDVIMIGEMRDFSTMQTAISAAETGHLVVSTLHTNSAAQSLDRIIDTFPVEAQNQLRIQLASTLLGVVAQRLVRRADGNGRVVACEVLARSPTVEKLILEGRTKDLDAVMEDSNLYYKMQTMNQALERLVREGVVTKEEAILNSDKKEDLELKLSGMVAGSQGGVEAAELMKQASDGTRSKIREIEGESQHGTRTIEDSLERQTSGIVVEGMGRNAEPKTTQSKLTSFFKKKPA